MSQEPNPYASPAFEPSGAPQPPAESEAELLRRRYIGAETSIHAIGGLFYLVGGAAALAAVVATWSLVRPDDSMQRDTLRIVSILGVSTVLAGVFFTVAHGLRAFRPWGRKLGAIVIAMILAATLFTAWQWWLFTGTVVIMGGCGINLLLGRNGKFVFSRQYADIREQTPHIEHRPGGASLLLLVVLVLLVLGLLVPAIR